MINKNRNFFKMVKSIVISMLNSLLHPKRPRSYQPPKPWWHRHLMLQIWKDNLISLTDQKIARLELGHQKCLSMVSMARLAISINSINQHRAVGLIGVHRKRMVSIWTAVELLLRYFVIIGRRRPPIGNQRRKLSCSREAQVPVWEWAVRMEAFHLEIISQETYMDSHIILSKQGSFRREQCK